MSKHKFFSLLAILGMVLPGSGPLVAVADTSVVVLQEDFESVTLPEVPGGWAATGNWGTYQGDPEFGKVAYGDYFNFPYVANANGNITSPTLDLSNANSATISFKARCETQREADTDYVALLASADGSSFSEIARWNKGSMDSSGTAEGPVLEDMSFDIPDDYFTAAAKVQFKWVTNAENNEFDGCFVDDVHVEKSVSDEGTTLTTSIVSVGNDTTSPYTVRTATPAVTIEGAAGMMCRWDFDGAKKYGAMDPVRELSINSTRGTATLSDLGDDGSKTIYVNCKDSAGVEQAVNQNLRIDFTLNRTVDATAPVLSGFTVSDITSNSAAVEWTTDEDATSVVEYGVNEFYGAMASTSGLSTSHSVELLGLTANTQYYILVKTADDSGNETTATTTFFTADDTDPGTTTVRAVLSGAPSGTTESESIDVTVGGEGITHYKFMLDGRPWSAERPVSERIQFFGLAQGAHTLSVVGKTGAGVWQSESDPTVASWTVGEKDDDNDNGSHRRRRSGGGRTQVGSVLGASSGIGDFNRDGRVDFFDFNLLMSQWGLTSSFADVNSDSMVDLGDFNALMINWTK
jgi:hypothetical protein